MIKKLNILRRAVEDGLEIDKDLSIIDALGEAESYIRDEMLDGGYDRLERVELTSAGGSQNYTWEGNTVSGDIFDHTWHYTKESGTLIRVADGEPVAWYDIPAEGPEREDYGFIYAREFDKDGQLVALYDTFKDWGV